MLDLQIFYCIMMQGQEYLSVSAGHHTPEGIAAIALPIHTTTVMTDASLAALRMRPLWRRGGLRPLVMLSLAPLASA